MAHCSTHSLLSKRQAAINCHRHSSLIERLRGNLPSVCILWKHVLQCCIIFFQLQLLLVTDLTELVWYMDDHEKAHLHLICHTYDFGRKLLRFAWRPIGLFD